MRLTQAWTQAYVIVAHLPVVPLAVDKIFEWDRRVLTRRQTQIGQSHLCFDHLVRLTIDDDDHVVATLWGASMDGDDTLACDRQGGDVPCNLESAIVLPESIQPCQPLQIGSVLRKALYTKARTTGSSQQLHQMQLLCRNAALRRDHNERSPCCLVASFQSVHTSQRFLQRTVPVHLDL